MKKNSPYPPGCTPRDIDRAMGQPECIECGYQPNEDELDQPCPRCDEEMERAEYKRQYRKDEE